MHRRVIGGGEEFDRHDGKGHGASEGMQVVGELPPGDRPRPAVVPLECFDLRAEDRRRGATVVVDGPVVDAGAEVGEDVTEEGGEEGFEGGAGIDCGGH